MKIQLQYCGNPVASFAELIKAYPRKEFDSITRSTIPSLLYWAEGRRRIEDLADNLGYKQPSLCVLDFEYEVTPPKGKGRASCTDVMISWEDVAVGVEAKYTEPHYDIVEKWIKKGSDEANRKLVLEGWIDLIQRRSKIEIGLDDFSNVPYQMVHRLASVCSRKEHDVVLYYQVFNPDDKKQEYYKKNLQKIKGVLEGSDAIRIVLSFVCIEPKKFQEIKSGTQIDESDVNR